MALVGKVLGFKFEKKGRNMRLFLFSKINFEYYKRDIHKYCPICAAIVD